MSGSKVAMDRPPHMPDFDRHAKEYTAVLDRSLRPSGYSSAFFAERKVREMAEALEETGARGRVHRLLNFGCGTGSSEPFLAREFPQAVITSIDVSSESLAAARNNNRDLPNVRFHEFDGRTIPFPPGFDAILVAGVLHHIPPAERLDTARELHRMLAADGALFLFEHNPWNPFTRKIVRDCPFDDDAVLLPAPAMRSLLHDAGFGCSMRYIHFFPGSLRRLLPLERYLRQVPLGAQYYCFAQKRRA